MLYGCSPLGIYTLSRRYPFSVTLSIWARPSWLAGLTLSHLTLPLVIYCPRKLTLRICSNEYQQQASYHHVYQLRHICGLNTCCLVVGFSHGGLVMHGWISELGHHLGIDLSTKPSQISVALLSIQAPGTNFREIWIKTFSSHFTQWGWVMHYALVN